MTAVTPTDRPKSVRNSCVIKVFGGVFMLSRCFLDCSVGVGVFVTGLSQISSFFSFNHFIINIKKLYTHTCVFITLSLAHSNYLTYIFMHTGKNNAFLIQNYFGDKKYVNQYLKYCTIQYLTVLFLFSNLWEPY